MENTKTVEEKIQIIVLQTDYTKDEAQTKLSEFDNDHIKVIRSYLGITEKKAPHIKSINQEIYKQIRERLREVDTEIVK
jgi:hypothetical protein